GQGGVTRLTSIVTRVVALHIVAIAAASLLIPLALFWLLGQAANNLHRDALHTHAVSIASFLRPQESGVTLDIPEEVRPVYSGGYGLYAYAVLDAQGNVLFSSRSDRAALFPANEATLDDWF